MPLHQLELFRRQLARLEQHGVRNADLADVVQVAAAVQRVQIVGRETQRPAEQDGVSRQALAVAVGVRVARLDGQRQRHERGLGGVERVDQVLHPRERCHARAQLVRVDRLRQELVGARLDPLDAIGHVRQPGHQDHRRQPRGGIGLEPAADLEAVQVRHPDVEEDDVRMVLLHRVERLRAVLDGDHLMAVCGSSFRNSARTLSVSSATSTRVRRVSDCSRVDHTCSTSIKRAGWHRGCPPGRADAGRAARVAGRTRGG